MSDVTVIIPNYKGLDFIRDCLDSLKAQNGDHFETIVVDNASRDGSAEIVENEYEWVQLVRLEQNFGFSRAVNEGISTL